MSTADQIVDITEYSQERVAELVADLETHVRASASGLCADCERESPCPTRHNAERALYVIGYMRSTDHRFELRDLADYVTWLRREIRFREALPPAHPHYGHEQAGLPMLRDRLAASEARLVEAAEKAFPEFDIVLDGLTALYARRREALASGEIVAPTNERIDGHQTDTVGQ
jgi:hypothetical protein